MQTLDELIEELVVWFGDSDDLDVRPPLQQRAAWNQETRWETPGGRIAAAAKDSIHMAIHQADNTEPQRSCRKHSAARE